MKKKLEKLVAKLWDGDQLYKGWHVADQRHGWIVRPFGQNEIYLGKNLADAVDFCEAKLDA